MINLKFINFILLKGICHDQICICTAGLQYASRCIVEMVVRITQMFMDNKLQ